MKIADYYQKQAEKMKDQASIHVTMGKMYESKVNLTRLQLLSTA
jgi:hypothetical protein